MASLVAMPKAAVDENHGSVLWEDSTKLSFEKYCHVFTSALSNNFALVTLTDAQTDMSSSASRVFHYCCDNQDNKGDPARKQFRPVSSDRLFQQFQDRMLFEHLPVAVHHGETIRTVILHRSREEQIPPGTYRPLGRGQRLLIGMI